jgi:hypothetical protein
MPTLLNGPNGGLVSPLKFTLSFSLHVPSLFHGALFVASSHMRALQGANANNEVSRVQVSHLLEAIQFINKDLNSEAGFTDMTMSCMLFLANYEVSQWPTS